MTSDLTCRELTELVTDYLDLALPGRERVRVEQHLVVCSACSRFLEQMRATVDLTGRTVELDELGPESRRALLATLEPWLSENA
jgi:predicted anti-sigma-YlaC factor YlaD